MKAFVLENISVLNFKDISVPALKEDEVLVEVKTAGICGSDIPRIFKTGTYNFPTIPGHEFAGVVVKTGNDENQNLIGKRVSVFPLIPCKECSQCKDEKYEMCENYNYIGSRTDGAFAEYVKVPVWNLLEIDDAVSFENAAMFEPACVALHAVRRIAVQKDDVTVVYGTGTIGMLILQWLSAFKIKNIIAIGTRDEQQKLIKKIGNIEFYNINNFSSEEEFLKVMTQKNIDIIFECVGKNSTINNSLNFIKPEGKIVYVGNPESDVLLNKGNYWKILRKQLQVSGVWNSSFTHNENDDWNMTSDFITKGKINPSLQITHKFKFEELNEALELMKNKKQFSNKIIISR